MWTFFVELFAEAVKSSLLAPQGCSRRPSRLLLESLVHALVSTVLLGVTGLDQFGINAEPDPPHGESAKSSNGGGGKGHTIVGANDPGKSVFLEEAAKDGHGTLVSG